MLTLAGANRKICAQNAKGVTADLTAEYRKPALQRVRTTPKRR
jgi:hypothetical protein